MTPIDEKRDAFRRAEELLDQTQDEILRYAILEVRRCLEAVAYEKLWAYKDRLPAAIAKKWQPPQAFKALIAIEPDAGRTSIIRFAEETEFGMTAEGPYKQLGVDLRPDMRWLSKTYNMLGSFLHAEFPYAPAGAFADTNKVRTKLRAVIEEIRPFVEKTFTWTVAEIISFECAACNELVLANKKGVDAAGYATCLNDKCGLRYLVKGKRGEDFELEPESCSVDCLECGGQILFPAHMLSADYEFSCTGCHCRYKIAHEWAYKKIMKA